MTPERINVLLVEDNPADARLIEEMLKDAQAKVSLTAVGCLSAGIERLESNKVDVVLLDLGLPESTGLDTYHMLREKFPELAIVVLTGLDDYEVATTAVREGAQDYLVKGHVDPNPLARSIRYAYDRKQAESALRVSEEKYRILFAANLAGVYRSTPEGKILECNEAMARILGYRSPEELTKVKTPATYVDPAEREILLAQLEQRKSMRNYEIRLKAKSGETVWCLMNVVLMEESGERILQGNLVDITERREAELALRDSERKFRTLVENLPQKVFVKDVDCRYVVVNRNYARDLKREPEEMEGCDDYEFYPKELAERYRADDHKVMATGGAVEIEEKYLVEGKESWVQTLKAPVFDERGSTIGLLGVFWDISDRKRAEEQLHELAAVVAQTIEGVAIADLDGNISFANGAWNVMHGYDSKENLRGQHLSIFHTKEQLETEVIPFNETLKERLANASEVGHKRKDGTTFPTWMTTTVLHDDKGRPYGMVGMAEDITERKRAEEYLKYRLQIEEAVAKVSREFTRADGADLNIVLETLGAAVSVDRAYIFRIREGTIGDNTHEWCRPGRATQIERMQNLNLTQFPWALAEFQAGRPVAVADTLQPPEGVEIEAEWELSMGVRAVAIMPVQSPLGELEGLLGFDIEGEPREWRQEDIQALQIVAEMLGSYWARERAEKGIAQVAEELRELIDTANAPILGVDTDGLVNEWNQKASELTGYSQDDVLGHSLLEELVELEHKSALSRVLYDAIVGIRTSNFEYAMKTKSGKHVLLMLNATPRRDIKGEIVGVLGVGQDITELVEYREGLERKVEERTSELETVLRDTSDARDRIDAILKSVADGLIVTDMYNRVVLMNRAAEEMLGTRLSEAIGLTVDFAIDDATLRDRLRSTLDKRQEGYEFDFVMPGAASVESRILSARTSLVCDRSGEISGIVTIIHDVTHDREMDRMKTEFVSTAAHELRTPLTSIQGFSEILLTRDDLPGDKQKKYLSYINSEAVALANIINDLLDISRIESGKGFSLAKEHCDVSALFGRLAAVYRDRHPTHVFVTEFPPEPLEMFVDPDKMHQVLDNILSNAVKYSPDGGTVRVSAREVDGESEITVTDEGVGMTPEQVAKIFDKFYRADASNTAIEGTGLGMTIVKHIVKAHDGTVKVESELGEGTVATIRLPRG